MKMVCQRAALAAAFQIVSGVVPTRTPKPVLQNVKLQARAGEAVLIGTDQEVGIRYRILEADVPSPGEVLLPTSRVVAILREIQGDTVTIESTNDATYVRGERSEYKLAVSDPAEFPNVSEFAEESYHLISAGLLKQMIRRTIFATDNETTRYALSGVLVDLAADQVTFAATDTRRLAVTRGACSVHGSPKSENTTPVIPSKAMSLIDRSLTDDEEQVQVAIRTNDVLVKTAATTIYSRLVEGRFPRYQDVIPKDHSASVDLVVGPFHSAVRQAQIVTNEESRGVEFSFTNGLLTLSSQAAEVGQSKIELPISYEGEDLAITFDPRYVAEFLKGLESSQSIRLELTDAESAAVFKTDDGYQYIIMPLSRDR